MADYAELALEGVPLITDHYDKVYDPLKNQTKRGVQKVKEMREPRRGGGYESEDDSEDDYYDSRRTRSGGGRRSPRGKGSVVEERYAYRGPARASSAGRDRGRDRNSRGMFGTPRRQTRS